MIWKTKKKNQSILDYAAELLLEIFENGNKMTHQRERFNPVAILNISTRG